MTKRNVAESVARIVTALDAIKQIEARAVRTVKDSNHKMADAEVHKQVIITEGAALAAGVLEDIHTIAEAFTSIAESLALDTAN